MFKQSQYNLHVYRIKRTTRKAHLPNSMHLPVIGSEIQVLKYQHDLGVLHAVRNAVFAYL